MIVIFETAFFYEDPKMKISEKQIRNLVREEILREHKKTLSEDREARLSRKLRRAQRLAARAGNSEVEAALDDIIAMDSDPDETEGGDQSARVEDDQAEEEDSLSSPAAVTGEVISLPNDQYTYVYDKAASDATVASGRSGDVALHFTVVSGPRNEGETFALTPGHPLEAELKKQDRVAQDLERAVASEGDGSISGLTEGKKTLSRLQLRKMLQKEAINALTR